MTTPIRNIPVRAPRGRRRHALPETGGDRTMCGRRIEGLLIDNAMPDCIACLRAIRIALAARESV